jgi:hypothetical protein
MIIPKEVIAKNIAISFSFMALFRRMASGRLKALVAIIKARAVPKGTPFSNKATATGTIAIQLAYIGTPNIVAKGTEKGPVLLIADSIASWGMKLWIMAPKPTPTITQIHSFLTIAKAS